MIRIVMTSNPGGLDPVIRMGFFNTETGQLLDSDGTTVLGSATPGGSGVKHTEFAAVVEAPEGEVLRLLDVAVSPINDAGILYAQFGDSSSDSVYYLWHGGTTTELCSGGAQLASGQPNGAVFFGNDKAVVSRDMDGADTVELIDLSGSEAPQTLYVAEDGACAARPIADEAGTAVLWFTGNYTSSKVFDTNAMICYTEE